MVTFKQQMALDATTFANIDEFGELASYTAPDGTITNNVLVVVARQSFVQEYDNYSGLGASIAIDRRSLDNVLPHGKITLATGEIFTVQQIFAIDDVFITAQSITDTRISPQGMR
jgi:hypothetical protein